MMEGTMDNAILLIDSALRVTVILGVALGVTALLRRQSAALRHLVLALAMINALLMPLTAFIAPTWRPDVVDRLVHSVQTAAGTTTVPNASSVDDVTTSESLRLSSPGAASQHASEQGSSASAAAAAGPLRTTLASAASIIVPIWIAGVSVLAGILLIGLARLRWLASRSRRLSTEDAGDEGALATLFDEIASERGETRQVVLLRNDRTRLLVTWGFFRPRVMIPAAALQWSEERLRVVISHELAHVRRGDWSTQLAAELLRAVFWFNPLVWIACRRLRAESELACDDEVINGGIEGVDYAGHLLDLARVLNSPRHAWLSAPAMARASSLEGRISAMLNARQNRHPVSAAARIVTGTLVLMLTLVVAGFAQSTFYSFSGVVVDSTDRVVPGVELTLTNSASGARYAIKSDATGRFEFVGLPAGDYGVEVQQMGFKAAKQKVAIASNVTNGRIALQVGEVKETIVVAGSGSAPGAVASRQGDEAGVAAARQKVLSGCKPSATNTGGDITPPRKLVHVAPLYPEGLSAANIGGIVTMEALIDTDGDVQDVTVTAAPDPGLATAATESVKQWKYTPTLLNCAPIDVRMGVSVTFTPKR